MVHVSFYRNYGKTLKNPRRPYEKVRLDYDIKYHVASKRRRHTSQISTGIHVACLVSNRDYRLYFTIGNANSYSMVALYQNLSSLLKSRKNTFEIHQIHCYMVKTGLNNVPFTLSKLLSASIQDMEYAASIFKSVENPNLFMFNTMLRGYAIGDNPRQAFAIFNNLRGRGIMLDQFSFITTLKACGRESEIRIGQGIHGIAVRSGNRLFIDVKNTLLQFYCVCKRIEDAHKLFEEIPEQNDIVSWNTLMGGYLLVSQPNLVLDLFRKMLGSGLKVKTSVATVLSLLSTVGSIGSFVGGKSIHGYCVRIGFSSNLNVLTALIDMYAKMGHLCLACKVFDGVAEKDVVLWNCLIGNYARNGQIEGAVALLQQMKLQGMKPNSSTLAGLISACPPSGVIHVGEYITHYMEKEKLELDAVLGTALVDIYAKCGFIDKAVEIFERMKIKDVKSWTAMISGHGVHGQPTNAIKLFNWMEMEGTTPNEVTFLAILSACSHGGFVIEGMKFFEKMVREYGFSPQVEHYGCLIDLLGRAGMLEEAHKLIKSLPINGDATAWRTLLAACRVYGNTKMGECVKEVLAKIYEEHPADSLLISSTYAVAGRLADHKRTQEMNESNLMRKKFMVVGVEGGRKAKEAGLSTIEIDKQASEYNGGTNMANIDSLNSDASNSYFAFEVVPKLFN